MNYCNTIPLRKSIRRYSEREISDEILDKIVKEKQNFMTFIPLKEVDIIPVKHEKLKTRFKDAFGDYGKLLNAPVYFALTTEKQYNEKTVNIGFIGEQLIIYLTSLGISSSWLATFKENAFKGAFPHESGHITQVLISAGYASTGGQDKFINKLMGKSSKKRKKLKKLVFKDDIKTSMDKKSLKERDLLDVFEMARLAPSWHNTQPWRFIVVDNKIYLILDFDETRYKLKAIHEKNFYNGISMGVVMSHLSMCLKQKNIPGSWNVIPKQKGDLMRGDFKMKPSDGTPFAVFTMEN